MLVTEVGNSLCWWQVCDVRTKHCHQHKFPTHSLSSLKVVKGVDINMNQIDGITKFSDKVPNIKRKSPFNWRTIPKFCSKENPSKTQRPSHSESGHVKWWKVLHRCSKYSRNNVFNVMFELCLTVIMRIIVIVIDMRSEERSNQKENCHCPSENLKVPFHFVCPSYFTIFASS